MSDIYAFTAQSLDEDGLPLNPNPDFWEEPTPADQNYHPGAEYCIRWCPVNGGSGQQCCYDASGNLITVGGGAGTPDYYTPCGSISDLINHGLEDARSYTLCVKAGLLDCYLLHRTPNNGAGCACNPPSNPQCLISEVVYSCDCE